MKRLVKEGNSEVVIKASRFLGTACTVESAEQAALFIAAQKKLHYAARHVCYAYVLGENAAEKKASDDGEPSGTAGKPILSVIEGAGLSDCLICVTRYFGGTLLGTGGLVRAYTQAAREALDDAGICEMVKCVLLKVQIDYSAYNPLQYYLKEAGIRTEEESFAENVTMTIVIRPEQERDVRAKLSEMTGGGAVIAKTGEGIYPV